MKINFMLALCCLFLMTTKLAAAPNAYSVDGSNLVSVDIATGAIDVIGPLGQTGDFEAIATDPTTGILYTASDSGSLFTVDTTTGAATLVGPLGVSYTNGGMAFDSSGQGYLVTSGGLFTLNKSTGAASLVGTFTSDLSGGSFIGTTLYGSPDNGSTNDLMIIDTTTAALTPVGPLGITSTQQTGLTFDAATNTLYMLNESDDSIYSVNTTTGAATLVSSFTGSTLEGFAIFSSGSVAPVPISPITIFIIALSLLGFGLRRTHKHLN